MQLNLAAVLWDYKQIVLESPSGKSPDPCIRCSENAVFLYRQAKQIGVRNLVVTLDIGD